MHQRQGRYRSCGAIVNCEIRREGDIGAGALPCEASRRGSSSSALQPFVQRGEGDKFQGGLRQMQFGKRASTRSPEFHALTLRGPRSSPPPPPWRHPPPRSAPQGRAPRRLRPLHCGAARPRSEGPSRPMTLALTAEAGPRRRPRAHPLSLGARGRGAARALLRQRLQVGAAPPRPRPSPPPTRRSETAPGSGHCACDGGGSGRVRGGRDGDGLREAVD